MTLALVLAIIFIFIVLYDKGEKATLKEKHRKADETNLELQKKLMLELEKKISEEIDQMPPIEDYDAFFEMMYEKHGIPRFMLYMNEEQIAAQRQQDKAFLDMGKEDISNVEDKLGVQLSNSKRLKIKDICSYLHPYSEERYFYKDVLEIYYEGKSYSMSESEKLKYPPLFREYGIEVTYHSPKTTEAYYHFIMMLTYRHLAEAGFNLSWNNKESWRQEQEKGRKRMEEYEKKYPWLFK